MAITILCQMTGINTSATSSRYNGNIDRVNIVSFKNFLLLMLLLKLAALTAFALDKPPEIRTSDEAEEVLEIVNKKIIISPE